MTTEKSAVELAPKVKVENISELKNSDLSDISDATERTVKNDADGFSIGLKRSESFDRTGLEKYWKGVLMVPERHLFVGRLDGVITSSVQLVEPARNDKASSFACSIAQHFVVPWARGHGLAKMLLKEAETEAKKRDFEVIRLSVRENQHSAISLYESMGYKRWGTLDKYEKIDNKIFAGYFYYKDI